MAKKKEFEEMYLMRISLWGYSCWGVKTHAFLHNAHSVMGTPGPRVWTATFFILSQ